MFPDQISLRTPAPGALCQIPGLAAGHLHEIHARAENWAAAMAFALTTIDTSSGGPILLARSMRRAMPRMEPCGEGLAGLGIDPARLLIVEARDDLALLRAGLDAARCPGLAAVVLETWGNLPDYDLTASRRLVLAAECSRVPVIVLRGDAEPRASAAHNRWMIRTTPSSPLAANAPGAAIIEAELLRSRSAPAGMHWRLEWNDEDGRFREKHGSEERGDVAAGPRASTQGAATPVSGAVVSLSALRTGPARSCAA
jgi:protein ImuA